MNHSSDSTRPVVVCLTADCQKITVDADILCASHKFVEAYGSKDAVKCAETFEFPVLDVQSGVFRKIVEWCKEHKDLPDPVIEKDEDGRRKHFHFTDFEKKFLLDTPINELCQLVEAARSLDIRSQYVYGTQAAYSMLHKAIKSRKPKRIAETMRALGMDQNSLAQHLTQRGHT